MTFQKESDFEEALITILTTKGWESTILKYPTEQDLIRNWANILFDNNRGIDRLGDYPLTDGEMQQIVEQIRELRTPLKLNGFINGKTVSVKRDNPDDKAHFGKEVSLKIYDRMEIAAGQSRYQIVQQPIFPGKSKMLNDRRGDLMLLINGMPVFHLELKRSGVPVSQAYNQIEKYAHEGVFTGLFSLVQIFVAMNPEETVYFANPGPDGKFNTDYYFHWADFNNEPINDWKEIASKLLSIPMAHQLIGFYTVADDADGVLKVMRSYQYYAASAISDVVSKTKWDSGKQRGGYIWHTTGSGKTMTSFKSAQLIANSNDADKVVFLTDRIELGTQSLKEYRAFADENETVQATENTYVLISKLKSIATADTLIVTSIQKMSNIRDEEGGKNARDIELIGKKRLVFIVDEAHRSTFGDMLAIIKETFPRAIFFGFTGTPVFEENAKKNNAQTDVFGNELHRYSIADGIRDKNVLGFDPYKVLTFRDKDVRQAVALEKAKATTVADALNDPAKAAVYYKYMDNTQVKMYGEPGSDGKWIKGIEDYLPNTQYLTAEHKQTVIEDIKENWLTLSHSGKFHAIFATSSIPEAIEYYRMMKLTMPELKTSCLFDPNIDNNGGAIYKEDGLVEIIEDYNKRYGQDFTIPTHARFKKDLSLRLAHKEQYKRIERTPDQTIDVEMLFDESAYLILAQRYKELSAEPSDPSDDGDAPYDLVGYLTEIDTGVIDSNYMNSRFDKYLKLLNQAGASGESIEQAKAELHKSFASLTQEEQKFANIFLHDIERGDATPEPGKTLRDYITEYQCRAKNDQIHRFAVVFGLDEEKLRNMMGLGLTKTNINEFGRLDELKKSVDKTKAKAYFEKKEGVKLIPPKVNQKVDSLLREFIVTGGFEV